MKVPSTWHHVSPPVIPPRWVCTFFFNPSESRTSVCWGEKTCSFAGLSNNRQTVFIQLSLLYVTTLSSRWQRRLEYFFFFPFPDWHESWVGDVRGRWQQRVFVNYVSYFSENRPVTLITQLYFSLINCEAAKGRRGPPHLLRESPKSNFSDGGCWHLNLGFAKKKKRGLRSVFAKLVSVQTLVEHWSDGSLLSSHAMKVISD